MTVFVVFLLIVGLLMLMGRVAAARGSSPNPNANEPDVFATDSGDLDPESDTGEPDGWN